MMFAIAAGMTLAVTTLTASADAADAILINFTAQHCAPCQAMKPTLGTTGTIRRFRFDMSTWSTNRISRHATESAKTPTFVVISGGKEVTRLAGTQTLAQLRECIGDQPLRSTDSNGFDQLTRRDPCAANKTRPQSTLSSVIRTWTPTTLTSLTTDSSAQRADAEPLAR